MQINYFSETSPREQRHQIVSVLAKEYVVLLGFHLHEEGTQGFLERTISFYSTNDNLVNTFDGLVASMRNK